MQNNERFVVGWDIGGAHLKLACLSDSGDVLDILQYPTPVWKGMESLRRAINTAMEHIQKSLSVNNIRHAVTMTAELVDLFPNRHQGVLEISSLLNQIINDQTVLFYAGDNGFVDADEIGTVTNKVSSANWHATANFVASKLSHGVILDMGSTTTDIIPFESGLSIPAGYSDHERLYTQELLYTGMIRTPVMAIVKQLPYRNKDYNIMAEHFATMADVYRVTGQLNEQDDYMESADGKEKTVLASTRRLARLIGLDIKDISKSDTQEFKTMAEYIVQQQLEMIDACLLNGFSRLNQKSNAVLVGAGCGRSLISSVADIHNIEYIDFNDLLMVTNDKKYLAGNCAAAVAVADIARNLP